jgi:hypothetical protein
MGFETLAKPTGPSLYIKNFTTLYVYMTESMVGTEQLFQ